MTSDQIKTLMLEVVRMASVFVGVGCLYLAVALAMPDGPGSHASHGASETVSALRVSIPIAGDN